MNYIHARRRQRGWRYRLWSTSLDAYITSSCTEEEVRFRILCNHLLNAVYQCATEIETLLKRAEHSGSSGTHDEGSITGRWRKGNPEDASPLPDSIKVAHELSETVRAAVVQWIEKKKRENPEWSLQELSRLFPSKEQF